MQQRESLAARQELVRLNARLVQWLAADAYPRWSALGIDPRGGFIESIGQDGVAHAVPRRARVHPRQVFAFSKAVRVGWRGDVAGIVRRGIDYFIECYRRPDLMFRTLADADGVPLDERALLYDQAFALLGYSAAAASLDARAEFEGHAVALRHAIERAFAAGDGAFRSSDAGPAVCESNPHMHLLEACLEWATIGNDPGWAAWARDLVSLALRRFIRADSGALGESFTTSGEPLAGLAGRIIEPGHQFEWAWLLLRSESLHPGGVRQAALRLIDIGERAGVHDQVAVNALLDDFTVHDPNARFWPQTERLKAALLAARLTDEPRYWSMAQSAASSFLPYLSTPVAGLWFDVRSPDGRMLETPAPASTFYHLVGAILALDETLAGTP